jgi:hypothetical protein
MKNKTLVFFCGAILLPITLSSASTDCGPLWTGPRASVEWLGMAVIAPNGSSKTPAAAEGAIAESAPPKWVGYCRRGTGWSFRLRLSDDQNETLQCGAQTSDGWTLASCKMTNKRPASLIIKRAGVEKTLTLTH